ncbi:hypothetical protein VPH35_020958 [Triticum aestivum]
MCRVLAGMPNTWKWPTPSCRRSPCRCSRRPCCTFLSSSKSLSFFLSLSLSLTHTHTHTHTNKHSCRMNEVTYFCCMDKVSCWLFANSCKSRRKIQLTLCTDCCMDVNSSNTSKELRVKTVAADMHSLLFEEVIRLPVQSWLREKLD